MVNQWLVAQQMSSKRAEAFMGKFGLDPVARATFVRFLDRLARRRGPRIPALVLVTHHVEEITPAFTHALLLREGRVHVAGPRAQTLTSRNLSAIFGAPLKLRRQHGQLSLR
jgi:iron complex transport system ATP-binding protein